MNESILNYIRQNRKTYTREAITGELVRAGYNSAEVEAAWQVIEAEQAPADAPPWAGSIGQFPPGPVPGQTPPPDPFAEQPAPPPGGFSGGTWQTPPDAEATQQSAGQFPPYQPSGLNQPPPGWQQAPGFGQAPPPQPGFVLLDSRGRPLNREQGRGRQRFGLALISVIFGLYLVVYLFSNSVGLMIPYAIMAMLIIISSIFLWRRDRAVAGGLLAGLAIATIIPFLLVVIIAGICIAIGARF